MRKAGPANEVSALGLRVRRQRCYRKKSAFLEVLLNENHHGLIRQYLPKGMALDQVTSEEVRARQDKLNNRPRKTLGYKTPNDVYDAMKVAS